MSLRKKVLVVALALALAAIAGSSLTSTGFKKAVSAMASAVWGS
jgi:hypothetical protein